VEIITDKWQLWADGSYAEQKQHKHYTKF